MGDFLRNQTIFDLVSIPIEVVLVLIPSSKSATPEIPVSAGLPGCFF
jgi:hypothetical protein